MRALLLLAVAVAGQSLLSPPRAPGQRPDRLALIISPAYADDDKYEQERERAERERDRIERLQERARRDAERAQRDAEKAQRDAERAQRETEKAQRDAERARRAIEQSQQRAVDTSSRNSGSSWTPTPSPPQQTTNTSSSGSNGSNIQGQRADGGSSNSGSKSTDTSRSSSNDKSNNKNDDDDKENDNDKESKTDKSKQTGRQDNTPAADDSYEPKTLSDLLGWSKPKSEGNGNGQGKNADAEDRGKDKSDDRPVETGALSGMTTPNSGTANDNSKPKAANGAGDQKPVGGSSSASNPAPHGRIKVGADFELLSLGAFRPREIVASHMNAKALDHAKALGFKAGPTLTAPGQADGVRKLSIPSTLSETQALALLRETLPEADFGPNHVYKIIPAEDDKESDQSARVAALADGGPPCSGDHCFARDLIGWKPQLRSCARRVKVGLIDTSFDVSHPAFAGRKMKLGKFAGSGEPAPHDWHGTAVLSVLAGDAESATPGLVPDADFLLASTFGADSEGNAVADSLAVLKALSWLDAEGATIVNMSFSGPPNDMIQAAIAAMAQKGVVFVAAAGNRGVKGPASYPAAYREVIAVTAVGKDKTQYRNANRGDYVDVAAPGVNVWAALPGAKQGYRTGTSFAAPFVTGLLAAMPAARKGAETKFDILSRVTFQDLGEPGRDPIYGEGLPLAPKTCNEVGGVASLPWTEEAKRVGVMSVGAPKPAAAAAATGDVVRPAGR